MMSTVDEVERNLMDDLLRGTFSPGEHMRQEAIAEKLKVSKIPVREALQRLSALGLIRFESNRGAFLPPLTATEAEEIYAVRKSIEPLLLTRAIPNHSIVDLAVAEEALENSEVPEAEANWIFHRALYRPAGWGRALAFIELLHAVVAPYVVFYTQQLEGAADSNQEHSELLELSRAGDTESACGVLDRHLTQAQTALIAHLE